MTPLERGAGKRRIDQLLVDRGFAESREKAKALLLAGAVRVNGQRVDKPGLNFAPDCAIEVAARLRYVSRGGLKLEAALAHFQIVATGKACIDIGSSTGGFTDCLLQHGAARVHAVDVGAGQLDWKLRSDPRVTVHEGLNARYITPSDIGEAADLLTCDVSFISVTLLAPAFPPLLRPHGEMIILIKPQFEVGRGEVGKGGIVRNPALHAAACARVQMAVQALGFKTDIMESPIRGAEGNREFLLYARH
jgi:23S rRNA (cytidine1920-2'-O)/16S rRNA (cytidine1409-2'-O)-methyltransferase